MSGRRGRSGGGGGHGGGGEERWLLPYADMITLLLGLFIVLFAMSSIDAKKFDYVKRSLSQTFDGGVQTEAGSVLSGSDGVLDPDAASDTPVTARIEVADPSRTAAAEFDKQQQRMDQVARQLQVAKDVKVVRNERGIAIRLAGDALFAPGEYVIRPELREDLTAIARELKAFGHQIEIGGHTDGQPFDGEFGNQGLSTNRANAVHQLFLELRYPRTRMTTVGYGDVRPVVAPARPQDSVRANRRIEITIIKPGAVEIDAALTKQFSGATVADERLEAVAPSERFDGVLVDEIARTSKGLG